MNHQLPEEPVYPLFFGNNPFPPEGTEYAPPPFVPDKEALERMISSENKKDQPSKE